MSQVIFYEKPGCVGNARQKALLIASGHELDVRNLLAEPWTAETLRPFFGDRPIPQWFNASAPKIKAGAIDLAALDENAALALMIAEPILIRRPLIQSGDRREAGFDQAAIDAWLGLRRGGAPVFDGCAMD
ncbi:ArsC/Spx/MgsR family protein [Rhodopseudomonas sp.]|uniref:ArsC/Spx/MgsR family protein n=1 Tax=Rhodopseudomonas sp. TaxID=1078 RepID=UPI003B3A04A8